MRFLTGPSQIKAGDAVHVHPDDGKVAPCTADFQMQAVAGEDIPPGSWVELVPGTRGTLRVEQPVEHNGTCKGLNDALHALQVTIGHSNCYCPQCKAVSARYWAVRT